MQKLDPLKTDTEKELGFSDSAILKSKIIKLLVAEQTSTLGSNPSSPFLNFGSNILETGGGYSILGEPLSVEDEYAVVWKRTRLDTNELARLRFSEGWTVNRLVAHFGYSRTAIKRELKTLASIERS